MHGSVLRLSPPLVLTEEEARHGVAVLDEALRRRRTGGFDVKTLIKGGTVVTAAEMATADVLIEGERVRAVGTELGEADRVIDATGHYVMPGGIDVHTHMELPFGGTFASDDFATGTRAAAFGGTTTIVDFAVQGFGESLSRGARPLAREGGAEEPHRLRPAPHRARDQPGDPVARWTR